MTDEPEQPALPTGPDDDAVAVEPDADAPDDATEEDDEAGVAPEPDASAPAAGVAAAEDPEAESSGAVDAEPADAEPADAEPADVAPVDEEVPADHSAADAPEPDAPEPDAPTPDEAVTGPSPTGDEVPDDQVPDDQVPDEDVPDEDVPDAPGELDLDEVATGAAAAAAAGEPGRRVTARSRLAAAMRPKANRGQVLAALLCAGLGFGLVVQVQSNNSSDLDRLRQSDLVRLLTDVNSEAERLSGEEQEVRAAAEKLANQESSGQEAQAQARERLLVLGILSGTVKATGPGIELRIDDPTGQVGAPTLLDALQELRDAGAEAVQVGTVRVVASTAFVDSGSGVEVDGRQLRPPYTYRVIGDPQTLDAAMRIPGGVLDVLEQKDARGTITRRDTVVVDALHALATPQYARPAPEAGS
ncbi:MAG: DUF881 domain-containing protein [Kineosporiaceae bacterium]